MIIRIPKSYRRQRGRSGLKNAKVRKAYAEKVAIIARCEAEARERRAEIAADLAARSPSE